MENKQMITNKRAYQRKQAVTFACQNADVVIYDFPYRIWLEDDRIYIERVSITKDKLFHNENELSESESSYEISFQEGDSFSFGAGSITIFADSLLLEMPDECYETSLLEKAMGALPQWH